MPDTSALRTQVVYRDVDAALDEFTSDDGTDLPPRTACQPASDARHVDRSAEFAGVDGNRPKSACDCIDPNGPLGAAATKSVLSDEVCDDESTLDGHELDLAELERLRFPPRAQLR